MSDKIDIWMPLYVAEWDLSTGHLTNEQDGAYGRLVRWYWRNGRPPADDDEELASIVRVDVKTWRRDLKSKLSRFFVIGDGVWRHARVDATIEEWTGRKAKAAIKAQAAAEARWSKVRGSRKKPAKTNAPSIASGNSQAMHKQCPSTKVEAPLTEGASHLPNKMQVLPLDGQPALVRDVPPENEILPVTPSCQPIGKLEERRALAAAAKAAMGIKPKGRRTVAIAEAGS